MKRRGLFLFAAAFLAMLGGCKNFLEGGNLDETLFDAIAYANAGVCPITVKPVEGTGSTDPSGTFEVKLGFDKKITFDANPDYYFLFWEVQDTSGNVLASYNPCFSSLNTSETNFKITDPAEGIVIVPRCIRKLYNKSEPSPAYNSKGVSWTRDIVIEFNETPDAENFIFDDDKNEIPAGVTTLINTEDGTVYGLETTKGVSFKNIKITNSQGISLAEYFKQPRIDGKRLIISPDISKQIPISNDTETIEVTIDPKITYTYESYKIPMNDNPEALLKFQYVINDSTDDKAYVTVRAQDSNSGTAYPEISSKVYSIGKSISLDFTEDSNYQFLRWNYDPNYIYIENPTDLNSVAFIREKTPDDLTTIIEAVCAERLKIVEYGPVTGEGESVPKDKQIYLKFNKPLPTDEAGLAQLTKKIYIATGGVDVSGSFKAPVLENDTVRFSADKNNMITVSEGQTKAITVGVLSDFYYIFDGRQIQVGGHGQSFTYTINEETCNKAEINFTKADSSGTLIVNGFEKTDSTACEYSIGQEIPLWFTVSPGFRFNGWKIKINGAPADDTSYVKIINPKSVSATLVINEAESGITIVADTSPDLTVDLALPENTDTLPWDSDIVLNFNQSLNSSSITSKMLNSIKITMEGANIDGNFKTREVSSDNKKITLKCTANIDIPKGSTRLITVTVPDTFAYTDSNNTTISLAEAKSFIYTVDYTTTQKAGITFEIINGEDGSILTTAGTLTHDDYFEPGKTQFYLKEEINVDFAVNPSYQFYDWNIIDSSGNSVSNRVIDFKVSQNDATKRVLTALQSCSGVKIQAVCYKRPEIKAELCTPKVTESQTVFPKNVSIKLVFDHAIDQSCYGNINISSNLLGFEKSDYLSSISEDKKQVMFVANKLFKLTNNTHPITVTVPYDKIYYLAQDGRTPITTAASIDRQFSLTFNINKETETKTNVRYNLDGSVSSGSQIYNLTNDTWYSTAGTDSFSFNDGEVTELQYYPSTSENKSYVYKIEGWKIELTSSTQSDYTVSDTNKKTKGTIDVKNSSGEVYFRLEIDNSDPTKATVTSYKAMGTPSNNGDHLKICAYQYLVPVISNYSPLYNDKGVECNKNLTVTFNKLIDKNTVSLYQSESAPGSIQIVSNTVNDDHFESYFNAITTSSWSTSNGANVLTLTPKLDILDKFGNDKTLDLKVIFDKDKIKDTTGHVMEKIPEWSYRINKETVQKAAIKFAVSSNATTGYDVTVNGVYSNNSSAEYSIKQNLQIECLPKANDYIFNSWQISPTGITAVTMSAQDKASPKATVVINDSYSSQITITPSIIQVPVITTTTPAYDESGVSCDTPIIINFNMAMYEYVFERGEGGLLIQDYNGNDISNYFKDPVFSSDSKTLTIKPDGSKIEKLFGEYNSTAKIKVILTSVIEDDVYSRSLSYKYPENYTKIVCYNKQRATVVPSITSFTAKKGDVAMATDTFTNNVTYLQNIINKNTTNHLNISFTATDTGSGIKGFVVEETLVQKMNGNECNIPAVTNENGYTGSVVENSSQPNTYSFNGEYDLASTQDGVVKLVFKAINNAGNLSTQSYTYYVIRDTTVNVEEYYLSQNESIFDFLMGEDGQAIPTSTASSTTDIHKYKYYAEKEKINLFGNIFRSEINASFKLVKYNEAKKGKNDYREVLDIQAGTKSKDLNSRPYFEKNSEISNSESNVYDLIITKSTVSSANDSILYNFICYKPDESNVGVSDAGRIQEHFAIETTLQDAAGNIFITEQLLPSRPDVITRRKSFTELECDFTYRNYDKDHLKEVNYDYLEEDNCNYYLLKREAKWQSSYYDINFDSPYKKAISSSDNKIIVNSNDEAEGTSNFLYGYKTVTYLSPKGKQIKLLEKCLNAPRVYILMPGKGTYSTGGNSYPSITITQKNKEIGDLYYDFDIEMSNYYDSEVNANFTHDYGIIYSNESRYCNWDNFKSSPLFAKTEFVHFTPVPGYENANNGQKKAITKISVPVENGMDIYLSVIRLVTDKSNSHHLGDEYYYYISPVQHIQIDNSIDTAAPGIDFDADYFGKDPVLNKLFTCVKDYGPESISGFDYNESTPYWILPFTNHYDSKKYINTYTEEELNKIAIKKGYGIIRYDDPLDADLLHFDIDGIPAGQYVMIPKLTDKFGNTSMSQGRIFLTRAYPNTANITLNPSNNTISVTETSGDNLDYMLSFHLFCYCYFDTTTNEWIEYQDLIPRSGSTQTYTKTVTRDLETDEPVSIIPNTFYRFYFNGQPSDEKNYISNVYYKYYTNQTLPSSDEYADIRLNSYSRATITYSLPCLVETYSASINFDTIDDWERFGIRVSSDIFAARKDGSGNYVKSSKTYNINTNDVEAGQYYCVVVHFADGRSLKTTSIKK